MICRVGRVKAFPRRASLFLWSFTGTTTAAEQMIGSSVDASTNLAIRSVPCAAGDTFPFAAVKEKDSNSGAYDGVF